MADTNKKADMKQLAEQLVNLKVIEVNQLTKIFKEDYGIEPEAAAPVVVAAENTNQAEGKEEKAIVNVMLTSLGSNKIKVIQAIRKATNLDIKGAKAVTDSLPSIVKKDVERPEANNIKGLLEEAGAQVTFE